MPLSVEVVAPDTHLFQGDAEFVRARTVEGEIGILPGHIPVLAQLTPCEVKVREVGGEERLIHIDGGFMTVKDDRVIILAGEGLSEQE